MSKKRLQQEVSLLEEQIHFASPENDTKNRVRK